MIVVVDSSVWIDNIRSLDVDHVRRLSELSENEIVVGDIILLEVLRGARDDLHAARLRKLFERFRQVSMLGPDLAVKAAYNYRRLRTLGFSIRNIGDLIVGTYCIEHDYALLQNDRDFVPMAKHLGLRLA